VRWCPVAQRLEEKAELLLRLGRTDAQGAEHFALDILAVDTDRAAADLGAVEHQVVGLGQRRRRIGVLRVCRRGEGMVAGVVPAVGRVVLEHGEVHHPEEAEVAVVEPALAPRHVEAEGAQRLAHCLVRAGHEDDQGVGGAGRRLEGAFLHAVGDGRRQRGLPFAVVGPDPGQAGGAAGLDDLLQAVQILAGVLRAAGDGQAADAAAIGDDPREHGERPVAEAVRQVVDLHPRADVGTVGPEAVHRLAVGHPRERRRHLDARQAEHLLHHGFQQGDDVLPRDEAHLDVHLGELRLAVGAQILVAEAAHDLEVTVLAGDHEQLLEQLRRLRQGIELAVVDPAGHEVIAGALGRRARQEGRLELQEALRVEVPPDLQGHPVSQDQVRGHGRAAQVEVAVFQAQLLGGPDLVLDLEGRQLRRAEHLELVGHHLHPTRGHVGVDVLRRAGGHLAPDTDDELRPQGGGPLVERRVAVPVERHLAEAVPVAQLQEQQAAEVALGVHPARQGHVPAHELEVGFATGVRAQAHRVTPSRRAAAGGRPPARSAAPESGRR